MSEVFKRENMIADMVKFAAVPVVSALITIVAVPIISNVYPAEDYGKINLFYTSANILVFAFMLGIDQSFIRYFYEAPKGLSRKSIQSLAIVVGVVVDIVLGCIVFAFAGRLVSDALFGEYNQAALVCLFVFILAQIIFRILNLTARMEGKAASYNIQIILQNLVLKALFVIVAFYSTNYFYSILFMTISMSLLALAFFAYQKLRVSMKDAVSALSAWRTLFGFGVPLMVTSLVINLNSYIGRLILGVSGLFEDAGVFAIAYTLASIVNLVATAFSLYWSPFIYKNYKTEQPFIIEMHQYVMFAALVMTALIMLLQNVIFVIVGSEYKAAQSFFMLLMINPIATFICETTVYGITIKEKTHLEAILSIAALILNTLVTAVLVSKAGVMGAAIGVACSAIFLAVTRTIIAQKLYKTVRNRLKTASTFFAILILCVSNCVLYPFILLRSLIALALLLVFIWVYRGELASLRGHLKELIRRKQKSSE